MVRDDGSMPASDVVTADRAAPPRPWRLGYVPALDGLRAVAVVAVLLYHGDQGWLPGGFLGVDVFLVISGYLITCLLLSDFHNNGKIDLKRFWTRRARRLLPALFLMLATVSVYALLFLPREIDKLRGEVAAAVGYVENWYLVFRNVSYFENVGRPPLLKHVWSLAVEEQFYLLWPLLIVGGLAIWGYRRRLFFAIILGIIASTVLMAVLYTPYEDPSRVYYGTDTRAAPLLVGAALAFVWAPWRLTRRTGHTAPIVLDLLAAGSLAGLCWFFLNRGEFDPGLYRGGFLVVALLSAVAIASTVHPAGRVAPLILGLAPLRWIGIRSYGIYLWHWPVYMVTRPHLDVPIAGVPLLVMRVAITVGLAELSFRFVEEPIRHGAIGRWMAAVRNSTGEERRRLTTGFAMSTAAIMLGVVVIAAGLAGGGESAARPPGFPVNADARVIVPPSTTTAPTTTSLGTAVTTPPATTAPAVPPLVAGRVTMIGDSVMLGASSALHTALGDRLYFDALESRQFSELVPTVRDLRAKGLLGQEVVIQLGTNGTIDPGDLDAAMGMMSDARRVVLVNAKVPRGWEAQVNDVLADGARRYRNVVLLDWHTLAGARPDVFWDDGIHLQPAGAQYYTQLVLEAI